MKAKVLLCTLVLGATNAVAVFAQTSDPVSEAILSGTSSGLSGMIPGIIRVLKYIVIFGGAISLLAVVFNIIQGERDAAKKAGWWLVGLALGFIVLTLLQSAAANIG